MFADLFLPVLSFGTLLAALIFVFWSRRSTEARMKDDDAPKSTLASDKDSRGTPADV